MFNTQLARICLIALGLSALLNGCAPLIVGGAAIGGAVTATDRRTFGSQVDDQSIEFKTSGLISQEFGDKVHVNVNAFNRQVLLTGEAPDETTVNAVERLASSIENVRKVFNEVAVAGASSFTQRASDTYISGKVRTAIFSHKELSVNAISVTTERGIVYLMGRVTAHEANLAGEVAAGISGVVKVVKVFELMSEDELKELRKSGIVK